MRFGVTLVVIALSAITVRAEFQVNTQTAGDQDSPAVAVDGSGRTIVVWEDKANDVVVRRFDAAGVALGSEVPVDLAPFLFQYYPAVAASPTGEFVVTWTVSGVPGPDGSESAVYARRFDALGLPAGTAFAVNTFTAGAQHAPVIATDAAGNFAIAWESDGQDGDSSGIFAQRFAADGTPLGGEFQVNTFTADAQGDNGLAIAMAPDGRFAVSWRSRGQDDGDTSASGGGVYAQRYAADGTPAGGEFPVNTTTQGSQGFAGVDAAMDGAGNLVIVWTSNHNLVPFLPGGEILAQRYDSTGAPIGAEFQVNEVATGLHFHPAVAADAAGNFLVTFRGDDGDRAGMFGRYFTSDGEPVGGEFHLNLERGGEQVGTALAGSPSGQFAVAWDSACRRSNTGCQQSQDGDGSGVFAQRFASDTPSCAPAPLAGCLDAATSRLKLRSAGGGKLQWDWAHGPGFDMTQFGNPAAGLAGYALCIYRADGGPASLLLQANVPAGGTCGDDGGPCWRLPGKQERAQYRDAAASADGITRIDLRAGEAGRSKVKIKGAGPALGLALPVGPFTAITTQLVNGLGSCWQSEHTGPARANDASRFAIGK